MSNTLNPYQRLSQDSIVIDETYLNDTRAASIRFSKLKQENFNYKGYDYVYYIDGNPNCPPIFTLHDIGQNPCVAFDFYFSLACTKPILTEFCIYHISLPGQVNIQQCLRSYPKFEEMAEAIVEFIRSKTKDSAIGLAIGAGANIFIRACLIKKDLFSRLIMINGYANSMGWIEYISQKYSTFDIDQMPLSHRAKSYLRYHFFGDVDTDDSCEEYYLEYLDSLDNVHNLGLLLDSHAKRSPINLARKETIEDQLTQKEAMDSVFSCPVLQIISEDMPYADDCLALADVIEPPLLECIEFKKTHGFILGLCPLRITHAIVLFLQSLGYLRGVDLPGIEGLAFTKQSTTF